MAHVGSGSQASIEYGSSPPEQPQPSPGFEELAIPLLNSLYNFARWLVRDQSDAEDLVQEAYLKAFRNFTSFRTGTNFRAWMFQILKHAFLSSRTKLDNRMMIAMDLEEDLPVFTATCDSPESRLIERSDISAIRCAIERLPIIFREVVLLRDVEDASYQEISDMLSIPIGTVMSRLFRARKVLRELLASSSSAAFRASWSYRDESCKEDFGTPK
jgi:RNA polymerase sigma factor (sigma-70 family)